MADPCAEYIPLQNTKTEDSHEEKNGVAKTREIDEDLITDTKHLRNYLRLYFYKAFKWKNRTCFFHLLYLVIMVLQVTKTIFATTQMFAFGYDRANFSSVVSRGHTTLRHLLLQHWDASWETLPYPPAHGDFAVYTISDIEGRINFAVENFFNAPEEALGMYKRSDGDVMRVHVGYFDISGLNTTDENDNGLTLQHLDFNATATMGPDEYRYRYDITQDLKMQNITAFFQRYFVSTELPTAMNICVKFTDLENNGQTLADLVTLTTRISCASIGYDIPDAELQKASKELGLAVMVFTGLSLLATAGILLLAVVVFRKTRRYMKKNYRKYYRPLDDSNETDLPRGEYLGFIKGWDVVSFISDVMTMYGTYWIVFQTQGSAWTGTTLDRYTVWLGLGNILGWLCLLRFFNFNSKFHLLFSTLYSAFWDVMAYLFCVMVLFLGFWASGYVVLGPYHAKFATPEATLETLFSIVNGDEIFATMAILESDKAGGQWVWWFCRIYIWVYVSIFTVVVINLVIAIVMSAYENIRLHNAERKNLQEGPIEKTEAETGKDVTLCKPRTLRQIIGDKLDDDDIYEFDWGVCKCVHFHM